MTHTIDTLLALADAYAQTYYGTSVPDSKNLHRNALHAALTEVLDQLDIQAGSIEAVQAANQRLAQAAQPVREPLTLDRIQEIYINTYSLGYHGRDFEMAFVRAIERAHGIGSDV
jgi:hypothetical protein